jgi:hypothetical protein
LTCLQEPSTGFYPCLLESAPHSPRLIPESILILWRVMPLKTPFRLLIRFIYNFTGRNYNQFLHCYTFTQLTILTHQYSILSVRSVWYSHGNCRPLTAWVKSKSKSHCDWRSVSQ